MSQMKFLFLLILVTLFFGFPSLTHAASRFWVGGTGTWDATTTTHWSTISGGGGGASVPTASDDVTFDGSSGGGIVTLSATFGDATCLTFTPTNFTGTLSFGVLIIATGNVVFGASNTVSVSGANNIFFNHTTDNGGAGWGLTTAGKQMPGLVFQGAGGKWIFNDNVTSVGGNWITLTRGTLDFNGKTVSTATLSSSNSNTRTLTLGASNITITGTGTAWDMTTTTGLTFNANTSTITFTGSLSVGSAITMQSGGRTYNNLVITSTGTFTFAQFTAANVTRTANNKTDVLQFANNETITGTLTLNATSPAVPLAVRSSVPGTQRTITAAAVSLSDVALVSIKGAGAATWSGTRVADGTGNATITFAAPTTRYWVGNGGNWSDTAHWSDQTNGSGGFSLPLAHDTVIFDANSITSGGQTIVADMTDIGTTVDFSGVLNSPTVQTNVGMVFHGSLNISGIGDFTQGTGNSVISPIFVGGTATITSGGKTLENGITVNTLTMTVKPLDAIVVTGVNGLNVVRGTYDGNGMSNTWSVASGNTTVARTLIMGTGTWTITSTTGATPWDMGTQGGVFTFDATGSTLVITGAYGATNRTIDFGGLTYNNVEIASTTTSGTITVLGSNTFANLSLTGNAKRIAFTAGTTQTITGTPTLVGSAGQIYTLKSTVDTSSWTITKTTGRVVADYLSLQDSTATGGITWYAGSHSTSVSGNTGWTFTDAPGVLMRFFGAFKFKSGWFRYK